MGEKKRILIGSPIYQKKEILIEFLKSIEELDKNLFEIGYIFIDDNKDIASTNELLNFKNNNDNVILYQGIEDNDDYLCDEYSHYWNDNIVEKVAEYKNFIIKEALIKKYDYLFFIDSDIVLHPKALTHLIQCDKDIISNIFWTRWNPQGDEMPQVWLEDNYSFHTGYKKEGRTKLDIEMERLEFFEKLKNPGVYKVGGLGACTLIKRRVLEAGVNFSRVYNLSFWGEDRHFCVRAVANNFELYVDTYYPAYHIYRDEDLIGVYKYKEENKNRDINILGDQLFNLIKEGIQRFKAYNYEKEKDESYKLFMTEKLIAEIESEKIKVSIDNDSMNVNSLDDKEELINECFVTEYKMKFNESFSSLSGTIQYIEKGYKGNYSFYKESVAECEVIKISQGIWRINKFNKFLDKVIEDKPLVRKASKEPKLTLSMIVKNEGSRYLKDVLLKAKEYIDEAIIIDDGSTDNTEEIIKESLNGINYKIIKNNDSKFSTEHILRKQQWNEVIKTNPEWILFLDADEIFEDKFKNKIRELLKDREVDGYRFRLYDMWNKDYYRSDSMWYAHRTYRTFLIRYQENFDYKFNKKNQHCGRMPMNVEELLYKNSTLRLKHYGWSKEEDRKVKYNRYMKLDKDGQYGNLEQYESILDKNPNLEKWIE